MRWLALVALALACSGCISTKAEWDPAAYRAAMERRDGEEVGRQARAAEREQAMVGLSRERVHELLGKPPYVEREQHMDQYSAGWSDKTYEDSNEASLYIEYDRSWKRVVGVRQTSVP